MKSLKVVLATLPCNNYHQSLSFPRALEKMTQNPMLVKREACFHL